MMLVMFTLVALIIWGRSASEYHVPASQEVSTEWSERQMLLYRAMAGPVPAIAADLAVLEVFNIYANSQQTPLSSKDIWWSQLHNQLRTGQAMDPYFRDIYRLTEGLLAYEANKMQASVDLLSKSEPYLNSSDPLLIASFIAHQELHNDELAFELANRASQKPDAQPFTVGFASSLLKKNSGCRAALQFLAYRLESMPEKYQQGIRNRIKRLQSDAACKNDMNGAQVSN